jgi:hypothetical protein
MRQPPKLCQWKDIRDRFTDNLLLGNGASIAVDKRFSYRRLYEEVSNYSALNKELLNLFQRYHTTNFELILRLLLETHRVNEFLNIADDKTEQYYHELRDALIKTIRSVHAQHQEVEGHFEKITEFLSKFKKVLSLNYDLLVYWAMLAYNEKNGQWFKDCFVDGEFEKDFGYLSKPYGTAKGATLVFYPHGSLFLATEPFGGEVKVSSSKDDYLLDSVLAKWKQEDYIPLFVSEGTSDEKLRSITRNNYLNTVYDSVLAKLSDSLVIYGWSMSDQDQHILDALGRATVLKEIAISVYREDENWETFCYEANERIRRLRGIWQCKLHFFDAQSKGCWIH